MKIIDILKDIRLWIILLFLIRLVGITQPPLEIGHNWRQTTVTMVARNFLEEDNNILYPRIDIAGEKTGITGMEFPLLNYGIYLTAEIFGYQHWYGRLINLIISSLGLWFFYLLLLRYFSKDTAFYASIILGVSIWFQFSRKIMPDTFSMSIVIAGIYYGTQYLDNKTRDKSYLYLGLYMALVSLGVLAKLPSGFLLVVFIFLILDKQIPLSRKIIFSIASLIALTPVLIWYYYWVPYLVEYYGFWHFFMGKSLVQGVSEISDNLALTFKRFYDTALKYSGFVLFLFGLYVSIRQKDKILICLFIACTLSFSIIVFKAGFTFPHHNYYVVPFVPVMALIAGYGLSHIKNIRLAAVLLFIVAAEGLVNQQHDFKLKDKDLQLLNLERDLDEFSDRSDLVLINSGEYPTPMYFAHRKGWVDHNDRIMDHDYINSLQDKGLKYIVILKKSFGTEIMPEYEKILETEDYCIYKL